VAKAAGFFVSAFAYVADTASPRYSQSMKPPWTEFPDIPASSIGWRMGAGEGYYDEFYHWYSELSASEQDDYALKNPVPADWAKFYQTIRLHPWL
jgi:hypothetical protein